LGTKIGDIVEFETVKKLSQHEGFWFYTIGQRQGIGLSGGPWYVVSKDIEKNIVYISKNYHNLDKPRNKFIVGDFNPTSPLSFDKLPGFAQDFAEHGRMNGATKGKLEVKLRHGEHKYNCLIELLDNNQAIVTLDKNDQGIASGQFAVFYNGEICLGSAVIIKAL
jgi:tRNA-specific 2-thiouridylase